MKVAAIVPYSTVDELGRAAITIFTSGCNLDCQYCHNHRLIAGTVGKEMTIDEILSVIDDNSRFVTCVVISGGEPTLQPDLLDIVTAIKRRTSLQVYINSNGTRFDVIRDIAGIVDGISIDFKTMMPGIIPRYDSRTIETVIKSIRYIASEYRRRPTFKAEVRLTIAEPMIPLGMVPLIVMSLISWTYEGYLVIQEFDDENIRPEFKSLLKPVDISTVVTMIRSIDTMPLYVIARTLANGIVLVQ